MSHSKAQKISEVKAALIEAGFKISVRNRKLAGGDKLYFTVSCDDCWARRKEIEKILKTSFPESRLTSGGGSQFVYAEYLS